MYGKIFNIQKFCLHDGPGIRSTVFFKGCNLKCAWCANPESQDCEVQLTLDTAKCTACGRCVNICPPRAREIVDGVLKFDAARCSGCGLCVGECSAKAIGREGRLVSSREVVAEVMKDAAFYAHSGGGVTLSGGEVLMQRDFALEIAALLHREGIHVAIETAAAVPGEVFREFVREIDYVLIDMKHYDGAKHLEGTGVSNADILENIRWLRESGRDFLVRIPVIPGFNDSLGDAEGFAGLLSDMDIHEVELLPFHQLGEKKYELLGMEYQFAGCSQLHREELQQYKAVFEEYGISVRQ